MRKLLLTTAIVLLTTSAFAGGSRGLSAPQPAEAQKPFRQAEVTILPAPGEQPAATTTQAAPQTVEEKLKAAGELKSDGTPATQPLATPLRFSRPPFRPSRHKHLRRHRRRRLRRSRCRSPPGSAWRASTRAMSGRPAASPRGSGSIGKARTWTAKRNPLVRPRHRLSAFPQIQPHPEEPSPFEERRRFARLCAARRAKQGVSKGGPQHEGVETSSAAWFEMRRVAPHHEG